MNATRFLVFLLLASTFFSCSLISSISSEGAYLGVADYPLTPPDKVRVIDDSELKGMNYTRIALVEATGKGRMSSRVALIDELKRRAGLMGANAIVMPHFELDREGDPFESRVVQASTLAVRLLDD